MKRLTVELEPFETDDSHYYLRVNGRVVATLLPSDFIKVFESVRTTHNSRAYVKGEVEAYYSERMRDNELTTELCTRTIPGND